MKYTLKRLLRQQFLPVMTCCIYSLLHSTLLVAGDGKLLATAGLSQLEGSGGGGLVPWATLSGYDSREQTSISAFSTRVDVNDYRLDALGIGFSFYDRLELSASQQTFTIESLGTQIQQNILGLKLRLAGDVVYSTWPQMSLGLQYKTLQDPFIATALGANQTDKGVDAYLALTKVHLGFISGLNLVWNLTGRMTKANQLGLLGFGGATDNDYEFMLEASAGILLNRNWVVGAEYRQKPDKLAVTEEDWQDIFISYIPNKSFNLTLAWAELGTVAGADKQEGLYVSLTGYLW